MNPQGQLEHSSNHSLFQISGTVGNIYVSPLRRMLGDSVLITVHVAQMQASMKCPWHIIFENKSQIEALKTGDVVTVRGRIQVSSDPSLDLKKDSVPLYVKPMKVFLWGESWEIQSNFRR